ncbi:uncharacterized protein Tco025E_07031 [Trypanosoma conorhini]|uniref:SAC3/GANP/THP3 conserved domain-containing protein n=1 Tax=Trypanosoma conorhini TaxID=83891 RepID=A0A3S5IRY2_9TRYP|nr:uncharacterized protein Tco025E_07031 [Trypanosoma conorhini]RNF09293.1 hypothetical protein Tco025E_07031 [Trypanosoma conorhini]
MKSVSYISCDFLTSHGVPMTKPLRDWLNRASYLAKTRTTEADRCKYERWAIGVVEEALREPGGIEGKDWARVSPVMPTNAVDREPTLLRDGGVSEGGGNGVTQSSVDHRALVVAESMRRAPAELRAFLVQAINITDMEVTAGRKRYDAVTFMELIQAAQELQRVYQAQMEAQRRATPPSPRVAVAAGPSEPAQRRSALPAKVPRTHSEGEERGLEKERPSKTRRGEVNPHRRDTGTGPTSLESERTSNFFRDLVSCNAASLAPRPFIGESQELERTYSRYEPTPEDIRPRNVLVKALAFVLAKAKEKDSTENSLASARYLNEQLKGLRQDLRVQNIVDEFAVEVYERHALICLELGDIGEFNQCQASLKKLYEGLPDVTETSVSDFFCYRLAYLSLGGQYDALATELIVYTNTVARSAKACKCASLRVKKSDLRWTIKLCTACEDGDCVTICRAIMALPRGMHLLLKIYLQKCRLTWLRAALNCIRGMVSAHFVLASLGLTPVERHSGECVPDAEGKGAYFWLDGSFEEAEDALRRFFEMIKFALPHGFSFKDEVHCDTTKKRSRSGEDTGRNEEDATVVDAAALLKCVDAYIAFLSTRRDVGLGNAE